MKVGIIGAGFTGLAAAFRLAKEGYDVTVFEADDKPGGLAVGFTQKGWRWSLEKHYHHWFYSDFAVKKLADEVGHKYVYKITKTSTFIAGKIYQLDSPVSLMKFTKLSLIDRVRTACILAYFKITPFWRPLEGLTAEEFLKKFNGKRAWEILWKPLFEKKFSHFAHEIPASWFWARVKKRSAQLGYPEGGFLKFATRIDALINRYKGRILYKTRVESISRSDSKLEVITDKGKFEFDKVICTLPFVPFAKICVGLPEDYLSRLTSFKGIGAVNLMIILNRQFLEDGTYWLNVNEDSFPFLGVVEHTNFMDRRNYGGENIVYVGNYLPQGHPFYEKSAEELLREFMPYLQKINPEFDTDWIIKANLFKTPFAQPIIPLNYSKVLPGMATPIENLYLANIQQVYPWDRGTNYAVDLGERAARLVIGDP